MGPTMDGWKLKWDLYAYTAIMFINHIAFATTITAFGPTMVDMTYIFNTTIDKISLYSTFNTIGYLVGSLLGFLYKWVNRQLVVIATLTLAAFATALVPFMPDLLMFYLCYVVIGLAGGVWDCAVNVWLIEIWREKSAPVLQLSQFMFGVGTIIGPQLVREYVSGDFLYGRYYEPPLYFGPRRTSDVNFYNYDERRYRLETPFIINGVINLIGPVLLAIMFFVKRYEKPDKLETSSRSAIEETADSPEISSLASHNAKNSHRNALIGLMAALFAANVAMEMSYIVFSATFNQYIELRLYAWEAAEIMTAMSVAFTVARGVSSLLALKVRPDIMLAYHYVFILVALILLLFGQESREMVWAANIIIGIGFSAIWAAMFAYLKQFVTVTDTIGTILIFSGGLVTLVTPFVLGPFIRQYPMVLVGYEIVWLAVAVAVFVVIGLVVRKHFQGIGKPSRDLNTRSSIGEREG